MKMMSTKEVAEHLGVTLPRVHALIKAGRLPAEKMGRDYFIKDSDLKLVEDRKPGRPPKPSVPKKRATGQKKPTGGASIKGKGKGK